jgi:BirA family biotin operon repressor/biotin-[acetyl-CoA-carboxylase] ligase
LRDAGYEIVAVPHLGYQLVSSPDRLFSSEITLGLNTRFIGTRVYYFDEISSTMDIANQLGIKGAPEGTVVVAESQTKGRGRLGRHWISVKYKGIYFSLILRPVMLPTQVSILTLLSAVSICEGVQEVTGLEPRIKWPNDILLGNKKLGGILTELVAEMDEIKFAIIGVGLNVNNTKLSLPAGSVSLREHRMETVNRLELLQEILRSFEVNYLALQERGNRTIIDKWRQYALTLGQRVRITCLNQQIEGEVQDIDDDGALLVRRDSGFTEKVLSGDVVHCR